MCSCRVNPSCVMCGGWPTSREDPQLELPTLERLSRLDLGVHPILSFPDGQFTRPLPFLGAGGETGRKWTFVQEVHETLEIIFVVSQKSCIPLSHCCVFAASHHADMTKEPFFYLKRMNL